eukprot:SAG25_NODE_1641_length_2636_cov_1.946393_2_plen_151_part_00
MWCVANDHDDIIGRNALHCRSGGCDRRRVVSAKTSHDGAQWSADLGLVVPDSDDPPELEFYRIRPFYVGGTSRIAAHVLQYAPAPSQRILGTAYGRHPSMCVKVKTPGGGPDTSNGSLCHGPHLYEEWWLGPASGDAAQTTGWRRPYGLV